MLISVQEFTLEHGADLPPGGHPTLTGVLAQSRLQEEQRNTTEEEENKIRDEEDTCNHQKQPRVMHWKVNRWVKGPVLNSGLKIH